MSKSKKSPVDFSTPEKKVSDLFRNMISIGTPQKKSQFFDFMKLFKPKEENVKFLENEEKEKMLEKEETEEQKFREENDKKAKELMEEKSTILEASERENLISKNKSNFSFNFNLNTPRENSSENQEKKPEKKTVLDNFVEKISKEFSIEEENDSERNFEIQQESKEKFFEKMDWLQEDAEKFFGKSLCDLAWRMMKFIPAERPSLEMILDEISQIQQPNN